MLQHDTTTGTARGVAPSPDDLRAFEGLDAADRRVLGGRCERVRVRPGDVVFAEGDWDSWTYVLLDGELTLTGQDGCTRQVAGAVGGAAAVLSRPKPRLHTATACTPATLLRVDGSRVGYWHSCVDTPTRRWERLADRAHLEQDGRGCAEAASGMAVPGMPAIALKARALIERDECDAQALASLLGQDSTMASKLVRVANSPLFYGAQAVATCEQAIVRLGLKTTGFMVIAFAVRQLFDLRAAQTSPLVRELWEHSTDVAAIASVVARRSAAFDPGEAQLAGLLHDVGVIPFLDAAARRPELEADPEGLIALICSRRVTMGSHVLQRWNFSPALVEASVEADAWHRRGTLRAQLADLVIVAQLLSFIGKGRIPRATPVAGLPAWRKVLGDETSLGQAVDLLEEFAEPIDEIRSLLRS